MRRRSDHTTLREKVTADLLHRNRENPDVYLDFQKKRFADAELDVILREVLS